ncbi:hypothetical protein FOCC_FOCC000303 [Frankliniella occidentalis]|uniref:Uncharacterized protein LOC113210725 n=1 Tax=Frankliniella occidentalis TaxID=133901 RepID=A0A6J1STL3_FRAOC|nr:uncharacterized protein LOC113210725 [Frankliniella occidentalis]KAE8752958.1 hypothetical protein FOCC_FOCC000303 [Frankliniella occidentalis]
MTKYIIAVLAIGAIQAASAAPEPLISPLGVTRGFLDAAKTKVGAAQGITNAAIQAGSDGINLGLDAVQGVEAVKSNALRGAVNITRNLGTEVITQTRNIANHLPSALGIRGVANLGLSGAQGALDLGANAATGVFTGAQALVNGTLDAGRTVSTGVSGAAQTGVNFAGNVPLVPRRTPPAEWPTLSPEASRAVLDLPATAAPPEASGWARDMDTTTPLGVEAQCHGSKKYKL